MDAIEEVLDNVEEMEVMDEQLNIISEAPHADDMIANANTVCVTDASLRTGAVKRRRFSDIDNNNGSNEPLTLDVGTSTETQLSRYINIEDDDDEGMVCPICLEIWDLTGEHRLVALKCGHLFGDSCIRRWIKSLTQESNRPQRNCPQCKKHAFIKDILPLYAKRVRVLDNSIETDLRHKLELEKERNMNLNFEVQTIETTCAKYIARCTQFEAEITKLRNELETTCNRSNIEAPRTSGTFYKFALERHFPLQNSGCCRVLKYCKKYNMLLISSLGANPLFNMHGISFYEAKNFTCTRNISIGRKSIRDLSINSDESLVAVTSIHTEVYVYHLLTNNRICKIFSSQTQFWSCCFDTIPEYSNLIYIGTGIGNCLCFNVGEPNLVYRNYESDCNDKSPVINVASYPKTESFPFGGLIMCTLQSIWFLELSADRNLQKRHKLNVTGSFMSMRFDDDAKTILLQTRASMKNGARNQFIITELEKVDDHVIMKNEHSFAGSLSTPVMTRPTQLNLPNTTLITGFLQDSNVIAVYDKQRNAQIQSLSCKEKVLDITTIYTQELPMIAALTNTKCIIFKLTEIKKNS